MESTKYSSYAQIERDLEILKLEREVQYQKLILKFKGSDGVVRGHELVFA